MARLEKLTKEQEALIPVVRKEWLDRAFSNQRDKFDPTAARAGIEWAYKLAGLAAPAVLFVESPLGAQIACNMLSKMELSQVGAQVGAQVRDQVWAQVRAQVWDQVWAQVRDQVRDQVWAQVRDQVRDQVGAQVWDQVWAQVRDQVRDQVGAQVWAQVWAQVGAQVWAQVWAQVGDQVGDQVRDQVWAQVRDQVRDQVAAQKLDFYEFANLGWNWFGWAAWADFFERIGLKLTDKLVPLRDWMSSNIYDAICFRNLTIVCAPPMAVSRDEQNRLSSITGPAIEWQDGYKLWRINGVRFEEELHRKVTSGEMTAKEILNIEVIDQRVVALKIRGPEKLLAELDAIKLHHSDRGNELYCIEDAFPDFPKAYFLKYSCPSTGRIYVDGVDPELGAKGNADECMAWKHHLTPEQYAAMPRENEA